ncbi:bifunctional 3-oxoadipate enol-lactonase/4-carboxymuconolactone decarboxylase PcaDC [Actinacidiphila bryophytorum]|uniref:3-oxoadipate enol-lactonase n=1 Tax=Actinacidiphila bryophytorum TaxID=1436133 RepID=A0A9W4E110_9ACTN|nr:3-oxoadipate enol-lactonase [Actinacidiphila bryophytorum]MBM9438508.1 3-oxoadipate enol-lactonase [Actinacidiphila bryophytorum]MBN6543692.1 3-oxoadipate enol-lactonase [Actinacidiphila bryophytorum]CAG7612954.1 3-oxoadipate enol-lactonase [Actinacidiphila bryophytorum]
MTSLHHTTDGPPDAPALLLGPSLGAGLRLWDAQVPALSRGRRVVRYDLPGHGGSPAALLGEGTVGGLGALVLELADSLGLARFAYAGVSLGGAVGLWLAVHHPQRVESLAVVCSSARFGEPGPWRERAERVRTEGLQWLADTAADRWFTPAFAVSDTARDLVAGHRAVDPAGYAACCDALAAYDLRGELARISAPVLVVAGRQDTAAPPVHARELADGIAGAGLVEIGGAAHLAPAEQPERVLHALLDHFGAGTAAAGTAVRRAVLGDPHVDRAAAGTTPFTAPFQDLITRYAWGEIWTRPGLDRRTRSCITLTALIAGGHHEELAMHIRAARTNGLSQQDIQEVLLQCAVYCGVPAANAAFAIAARVLEEEASA